ncbi:heparan-alpha-glucosaminide N-acetyltransferase domain-containing protein [Okibacterium fritillariae]|uniref:heparan-alpha-glucosaminide N-acetyltransferase domain-containing protein n=1 Tax=Okibacterium fritillariae TaxID=123320 RepID=UPI004055530D
MSTEPDAPTPSPVETAPTVPVTLSRAPNRIAGLDLARFVALIGMMAAHVWMLDPADGSSTLILGLVQGRAAALFAVLAGVGIVLSSKRYLGRGRGESARCGHRGHAAAARALFVRGAAVAVVGLTLGLLSTQVAIILVSYGVLFCVMIPLLRLGSVTLAVIAVLGAIVSPLLSFWARSTWSLIGPYGGNPSWIGLTDPMVAVDVLLTGVYPVATWFVYVVAGMAVGRLVLDTRDADSSRGSPDIRALAGRLSIAGAGMAVVAWALSALAMGPLGGIDAVISAQGELPSSETREQMAVIMSASAYGVVPLESPWLLASSVAHSGATLDLFHTGGSALVVIGIGLLIGTRLRHRGVAMLAPVLAAGAAPLTIYSLHVVVQSLTVNAIFADGVADVGERWMVSSLPIWLLHIAGALFVGLLLWALQRRGPLESLISWLARLAGGPRRSADHGSE